MTDNLTKKQRSYCMSQVKGRDTSLERLIRSELHKSGLRFRKHVSTLPGKPDIVFPRKRLAVFLDGDFWHGYRFPQWENKIPSFWKKKINETRKRDRRNHQNLRNMGWKVIRIWQHQIKNNPEEQIEKIVKEVINRV